MYLRKILLRRNIFRENINYIMVMRYDRTCYLSSNLRHLRQSAGLSYQVLSKIVGITATQLGNIEKNLTPDPGVFPIEAISTFFGYEVSEILWKKDLELKSDRERLIFLLTHEFPDNVVDIVVSSLKGIYSDRIKDSRFDSRFRKSTYRPDPEAIYESNSGDYIEGKPIKRKLKYKKANSQIL